MVGVIDNNCVGVGNINAVFHNVGGDQHVKFMMIKIVNNLLQARWFHLAVSRPYSDVGHQFTDHFRDFINIFHPVVDKKDLASACNFLENGFADKLRVHTVNFGIDRLPVGGRRVDYTQVAGTHQRELKGSGDGSCRHGHHVNRGPEPFELLFHGNAKSLLLINNHQAELFKIYVFGDNAVSSDQNINLSGIEILNDLFLLGGGAET